MLDNARSHTEGFAAEFCLLVLMVFFFFFFSSRRRHTRSLCDWSSDVCSSDLDPAPRLRGPANHWMANASAAHRQDCLRSEERRVGKECRSLLAPEHLTSKINSSLCEQSLEREYVAISMRRHI